MTKKVSNTGRRQLLKTLALGGAAAGVATVGGQAMAATPDTSAKPVDDGGYRETDHIRSYYDSLRSKR